jgi:hypothetical protein
MCYENSVPIRTFNVVFCTLASPLVIHIIPTVIILAVNSSLIVKIIIYYKNLQRNQLSMKQNSRRSNRQSDERNSKNELELILSSRRSFQRPLCRTQKSHHFVIIISSMWLVLTTTPYYTLNGFYLLLNPSIFPNDFDYKQISKFQVISSILFNSNHCFNFLIYFSFNFEFRKCIYKPFRNSLNFLKNKTKVIDEAIELENINRFS